IALIGVLSMQGDTNPMPLMVKGASLRGIFVGSAAMARDLGSFVDAHRLKPVIDRVFDFEAAKSAYAYQSSGELFGNVVIANPWVACAAVPRPGARAPLPRFAEMGAAPRRLPRAALIVYQRPHAPPRRPGLIVCVTYKMSYHRKPLSERHRSMAARN